MGARAIEAFADGTFPAHLVLKSNLYGHHEIDGQTISKGTVTNCFVERVLSGEPLTVYEPGTQARNYVHVKDVAWAYLRSGERLVEQLVAGETGVATYEIASDEDPSAIDLAELVREIARAERGIDADVKLVENPRGNETLVEDFAMDTSAARDQLGWSPERSVEESVRTLLRDGTAAD